MRCGYQAARAVERTEFFDLVSNQTGGPREEVLDANQRETEVTDVLSAKRLF